MRELVLASGSPWRRAILENAGVKVRAVVSGVDETRCEEPDPIQHAAVLARWKAEAVRAREGAVLVLGSDQVMWDGKQIYGKPATPKAHFEILCGLRGRDHWLHTAFCLLGEGVDESGVVTTRLRMRSDLSDSEIQAYVDTEEGRFCAGGYAIEGHGGWLFDEVDGDWFNIVGLPLFRVLDSLRRHGWVYGR